MYKVKEIKGFIFSATLTDGSFLTILPCEEATVKKSQISDTLEEAVKRGRVTMSEVTDTNTTAKTKEKTGGAK